ncbi:hypothetical protein [Rubrivirga sp.]|uniref:hypothetical protein n=1 Tax=Rubrivirga sp. TaxID=1885344 RepID=UPI003B526C08
MSASTLASAALLLVVLAWAGLTVWNSAARARLDRMKPEIGAAFQAHAASYAERGELPPPVYWDFRRGRVAEYPPGVAEVVRGEGAGDSEVGFAVATVVRADAVEGERWPVWMWGVGVGFVPPGLFHGLFGAASAALLVLWLRLRAG